MPLSKFLYFRSHTLSVFTFLLVGTSAFLTGCGTGSTGASTADSQNCVVPNATSAQVPVLFTSDAALGALTNFQLGINSIALTDACGKSVTAYTAPTQKTIAGISQIEFTHVTGVSEPLTVATVPQATYTAVSIAYNWVDLAYLYPDNIHYDTGVMQTNPISAKVDLAAPIIVDGHGTALTTDLLLNAPIVLGPSVLGSPITTTPAFRVTAFRPSAQPSNDRNGTANLHGLTASVAQASSPWQTPSACL